MESVAEVRTSRDRAHPRCQPREHVWAGGRRGGREPPTPPMPLMPRTDAEEDGRPDAQGQSAIPRS
jgi:hypothetical protein